MTDPTAESAHPCRCCQIRATPGRYSGNTEAILNYHAGIRGQKVAQIHAAKDRNRPIARVPVRIECC